jgi:hypothetical protein
VIESKTVTRLVCPTALNRDLGPQPQIPPDAVIRHNDSGGDYLDARIARGQAAEAIVNDSRAECAEKGAGKP